MFNKKTYLNMFLYLLSILSLCVQAVFVTLAIGMYLFIVQIIFYHYVIQAINSSYLEQYAKNKAIV